jgi:hypothetical protein
MKKKVSIGDIAREFGVSYSLVCRILNNDPKFKPSKNTRAAVIRKAQEMGFDYSSLRRIHRRKSGREKLELNAEVIIRKDLDNEVFDSGTAVIRDLSPHGAAVSDLDLEGGSIPVCPFHCEFNLTESGLKGIQLKAKPVRLGTTDRFVLGMQFIDLKNDKIRLITSFLKNQGTKILLMLGSSQFVYMFLDAIDVI